MEPRRSGRQTNPLFPRRSGTVRPSEFGIEQVVDADRAYSGSRFREVRDAVFSDPYPGIWDGDGRMPTYQVTLKRVLSGLLPFARNYFFQQAVARSVDSPADLRWGPDQRGFRRLLHPNGVCLSGRWEITEPNPYSGYFKQGSQALAIGRYSTCCSETRRGHTRSLALVGKLFPTMDPDHATPLRTASFITQQDLGGARNRYINDAQLSNAPNTSGWRRFGGIPVFLVTGALFSLVDREPTIRQLYAVAELGQPNGEPTRTPIFMRLPVVSDQPRIEGDDLDFRDEIVRQIFDRGDRAPKRQLSFGIEVTDVGQTHGSGLYQRRDFQGWRRIGTLTFDDAVASYNGDFVLHFNHPTWRSDRNDPATATRVGEKKMN
jgi:hypothetical protein